MSMKAVIFDMDGVLVDTVDYHYLSWKKAICFLEIPFSRPDNDRLRGLSRNDSLNVILAGMQISEKERAVLLERKNKYFIEYVNKLSSGNLLPGVQELLGQLKKEGISTGVSSSSKNVRAILEKLQIGGFIDAVGDGHCVDRLKPDPDIFFFTASALGLNPEDCLVIEDGEAGIAAGLSAGMCVVGVGPYIAAYSAHAVFPDLSEVRLKDLQKIYLSWYNILQGAGII